MSPVLPSKGLQGSADLAHKLRAPLFERAREPGLPERAKAFDVVVDVLKVERQ